MASRYKREPNYEEFRLAVLKRDKYKCQMPYCDSKHNLVVHHIKLYAKHPTIRLDPNNGITLCRKCHKTVRGKEKHYAPMFLRIVAEKCL